MAERRIDPAQRAFGEGLVALATALGFELDRLVIRVYWKALEDVPAEFREAAILDAGTRTWFKFPTPAELKEIGAKLLNDARMRVYREAMAPACPICDGGRWKPVTVNGVERLEKCDCIKQARLAADRVGQAVALPPSREQLAEQAAEQVRLSRGDE